MLLTLAAEALWRLRGLRLTNHMLRMSDDKHAKAALNGLCWMAMKKEKDCE